jgi:hypothetical protein
LFCASRRKSCFSRGDKKTFALILSCFLIGTPRPLALRVKACESHKRN